MQKCASLPMADCCKRGTSGALQCLPSPLPTQLLSSPTLQDPRLPTVWALWAIPSHRQQFHLFTENFRSWSFNSVSEGKKIRSSPILHKMECPFSPLLRLRCKKRLSSEKEQDQSYALQAHTVEETQTGTDFFSCSRSEHTGASWRFRG